MGVVQGVVAPVGTVQGEQPIAVDHTRPKGWFSAQTLVGPARWGQTLVDAGDRLVLWDELVGPVLLLEDRALTEFRV